MRAILLVMEGIMEGRKQVSKREGIMNKEW
jgi:hypothetical protein